VVAYNGLISSQQSDTEGDQTDRRQASVRNNQRDTAERKAGGKKGRISLLEHRGNARLLLGVDVTDRTVTTEVCEPIRSHCNTPEATEQIGQEVILSKVAHSCIRGSRQFLMSVLGFRTE